MFNPPPPYAVGQGWHRPALFDHALEPHPCVGILDDDFRAPVGNWSRVRGHPADNIQPARLLFLRETLLFPPSCYLSFRTKAASRRSYRIVWCRKSPGEFAVTLILNSLSGDLVRQRVVDPTHWKRRRRPHSKFRLPRRYPGNRTRFQKQGKRDINDQHARNRHNQARHGFA